MVSLFSLDFKNKPKKKNTLFLFTKRKEVEDQEWEAKWRKNNAVKSEPEPEPIYPVLNMHI